MSQLVWGWWEGDAHPGRSRTSFTFSWENILHQSYTEFFFPFSVLFSCTVICGIKVNVNDFDVIIYSSYFLSSDTILQDSLLPLISLVAQMVKNPPAMHKTWVQSLGWEDPLENGMTTHSSILAWRIPWTKEPGRFMGSQKSWTWLSS